MVKVGDRVTAVHSSGKKLYGVVKAINGDNLHVLSDNRMYSVTTNDLLLVNKKKVN